MVKIITHCNLEGICKSFVYSGVYPESLFSVFHDSARIRPGSNELLRKVKSDPVHDSANKETLSRKRIYPQRGIQTRRSTHLKKRNRNAQLPRLNSCTSINTQSDSCGLALLRKP
jgi:hypothetical protein